MNTGELKLLVRARFCAPQYGLLWEVGNSTGFQCSRHVDALAMSLWPGRGLDLIGMELKVSRTDWVREMKNPGKSEPILKFCNRWYLVAAEASIVKPDELPETWGLMVPKGKALAVVKEAPKLKPEPVTKDFLAAIFRQSSLQSSDAGAYKAAHAAGWEEGREYEREHLGRVRKDETKEVERLRKVLADFREATGIELGNEWAWDKTAKNIGKAMRMVLDGKHRRDLDELARVEESAKRAIEAVAVIRHLFETE